MSLEIYALFDTNDCPKRLKSSGSDEFYYYFPPPLPELIVLFMVTKNPDDVNFLFKISVCIDNDLDEKDIGEMGGNNLSMCWNGEWTAEEIAHAETIMESGRVLKLNIFKEEFPPQPEDECEEVEEEEVEEEENGDSFDEEITEEEKSLNEDELLKSSIAMLEEELDESDIAVQKLQEDENRKNLLQDFIKGNMNGSLLDSERKIAKKISMKPKKTSTSEKTQQRSPKVKKDTEKVEKATKTPDKKASKKAKSTPKEELLIPNDVDSFEFVDETEQFAHKVVAGRIGGKRSSPFGVLPKISKKTHQETEDHKLKTSMFTSPLCFSDILPTRNPSRRWGHSFCPLKPGHALVIGGEGEKKLTNADAIWQLDTVTSTWKSEQSDNPSVGRRVGHTACYDDKANVVYLYGGLKHDRWFNDVYKLNIATWKWTKIEAIGKAPTRAYHSCTMDFEELLIFGGVYPTPITNPDGCSSELCIFSTESKSWYTPIVTGDIPSGRSGHSACMLDRKLYIFGGWDTQQCFNDIHVLDLGIMNFVRQTTYGTCPSPRTWHASQLLSDSKRFCVYGGFNGVCALDDLFIFSSVDNSWTKLFYPGLVCRAGHDVIRRNNNDNDGGEKLLVFGGGDNAGHFYNDIATLNLG